MTQQNTDTGSSNERVLLYPTAIVICALGAGEAMLNSRPYFGAFIWAIGAWLFVHAKQTSSGQEGSQ